MAPRTGPLPIVAVPVDFRETTAEVAAPSGLRSASDVAEKIKPAGARSCENPRYDWGN